MNKQPDKLVQNVDNLDLLIAVELDEYRDVELNMQILKNQGRIKTDP
jgi:hypothetical protein